MKSVKEILKDLGFNPEAPASTSKAFLRHLAEAAQMDKAEIIEADFGRPSANEQLSFDENLLGSSSSRRHKIGS
jgi:hypothetical protein